MNSMKSLAYLEVRKLARLAGAGRDLTAAIESAAADLLHFHPETLPSADPAVDPVRIVIGTERGFCGDLNQQLWRAAGIRGGTVLTVGSRLRTIADAEPATGADIIHLEGAGVAEEIPAVMGALVDTLDDLRAKRGALGVESLSFDRDGELVTRELLPPFRSLSPPEAAPNYAPVLNLPPRELLLELGSQFLYACLHDVVCASLLHENQRRMTHLDAAVTHLDDKTSALTHKANALRQEEITEEIEVILLSASPKGS